MHILSTSKENGVMHQGLSELTDTKINEEMAINITVEVPDHKTVEAYDPNAYPGWVRVSPDNPLSIETTLSINSEEAKVDDIQEYEEEIIPVFEYTYDCVDGCWKFFLAYCIYISI